MSKFSSYFIKDLMETERTNEDNTMEDEYRVKTSVLCVPFNDILVKKPVDGYSNRYVSQKTDKVINGDIIECNPNWFEKIEQVQEGDYFEGNGLVIRIEEVKRNWIDYKIISGNAEYDKGSVSTNLIKKKYRKLSTDEIEQALIKEAKRRGFEEGAVFNRDWEFINDLGYNTGKRKEGKINSDRVEYDFDRDVLFVGELFDVHAIYWQGNWAEIVDQTPHIEINGKQIEVEDGMVKISCGDIVPENTMICFLHVVNKYELKVHRGGECINKQLRKIAEYYE